MDSTKDSNKVSVRIMQWNVLADILAHKFPRVPQEYLEKDYRIPLIVEEMKQAGLGARSGESSPKLGSQLPDIIMCQEMDMEDEILSRINSADSEVFGDTKFAYEVIAKSGEKNDALCIFYNTQVYRVIHVKKGYYRGIKQDTMSRRCYLMMLFEHIPTGKKLAACTLHHIAREENRDIRLVEMSEYLLRLQEFLDELIIEGYVKEREMSMLPLIIAGDFNDVPTSEVIEPMFDTDMTYGLKLKCAYQVDSNFPEFTTYKYRSDEVTKIAIDYIFYNENLTLKSIREIPAETELDTEMGHPCNRYPSDHFSLGATFEY